MKVTTSEQVADEVNMLVARDRGPHLSLKTQMEMARGALGRAVNKEEAMGYIKELNILTNGEQELRKLLTKDWRLFVSRDSGEGKMVCVELKPWGSNKESLQLKELFDFFPSDELIAKVMLVAG